MSAYSPSLWEFQYDACIIECLEENSVDTKKKDSYLFLKNVDPITVAFGREFRSLHTTGLRRWCRVRKPKKADLGKQSIQKC